MTEEMRLKELLSQYLPLLDSYGFKIMEEETVYSNRREEVFRPDIVIKDDQGDFHALFEYKRIVRGGQSEIEKSFRILRDATIKTVPMYLITEDEFGNLDVYWMSDRGNIESCGAAVAFARIKKRLTIIKDGVGSVAEYLDAIKIAKTHFYQEYALKMSSPKVDVPSDTFLFRGQCKTWGSMVPSLFRNIGNKKKRISYYEEEVGLLNDAKRRYKARFASCRTELEEMTVAQHYAIPTRLLDITGNVLVALYFASCEGISKSNGEVFVLRPTTKEVRNALDYGLSDVINLSAYHNKNDNPEKPLLLFPPYETERQKSQDGGFYLFDNDRNGRMRGFRKEDYYRIIIRRDSKLDILNELESEFDIHKAKLFPESLADGRDLIVKGAEKRILKTKGVL